MDAKALSALESAQMAEQTAKEAERKAKLAQDARQTPRVLSEAPLLAGFDGGGGLVLSPHLLAQDASMTRTPTAGHVQ